MTNLLFLFLLALDYLKLSLYFFTTSLCTNIHLRPTEWLRTARVPERVSRRDIVPAQYPQGEGYPRRGQRHLRDRRLAESASSRHEYPPAPVLSGCLGNQPFQRHEPLKAPRLLPKLSHITDTWVAYPGELGQGACRNQSCLRASGKAAACPSTFGVR